MGEEQPVGMRIYLKDGLRMSVTVSFFFGHSVSHSVFTPQKISVLNTKLNLKDINILCNYLDLLLYLFLCLTIKNTHCAQEDSPDSS